MRGELILSILTASLLLSSISEAQIYRLPPDLTVPGKKLPLKYYSHGPSDEALGVDSRAKKYVEGNSEYALKNLNHEETIAVEQFLDRINNKLAPGVRDSLPMPVFLAFAPIRAITLAHDYPITRETFETGNELNPCGYPTNEEEAKKNGEDNENQMLSFLFEMNEYRGEQYEKALIVLDLAFLEHILRGPGNQNDFRCGIKTFYRAAELEVFRHIGRIYDSVTESSKNPSYRNLANFSSPGLIGKLLHFFTFRKKKPQTRNDYRVRTPDPREFASIHNHYWINFAYYHVDPEYYCRRPTHHLYLARTLGSNSAYDPLKDERECEINSRIPIAKSLELKNPAGPGLAEQNVVTTYDLGPESIYSIDSNLAGKGDGFASRWGHAMLRLTGCARFQTLPNGEKECLQFQSLNNVVVSFRANITDLMQNNITGFFGGYAAQSFVFDEKDIEREYTKEQLRDLFFLPLNINDDERETLLYMIITRFWDYFGSYKFLSRNCATDQWQLIQSGLPFRSEIQNERATLFETPNGVENRMAKLGLFYDSHWNMLNTVKDMRDELNEISKSEPRKLRLHPSFESEIRGIWSEDSKEFQAFDDALGNTLTENLITRDFVKDPFRQLFYPSAQGDLDAHYYDLVYNDADFVELGDFANAVYQILDIHPLNIDPIEFIRDLEPQVRYQIYSRTLAILDVKNASSDEKLYALGSMRSLEKYSEYLRRPNALTDLFTLLEGYRSELSKGHEVNSGIDQEIVEFEQLRFASMPWKLVESGYGIPLESEMAGIVEELKSPSATQKLVRNVARTDELIRQFVDWGRASELVTLKDFHWYLATDSVYRVLDIHYSIEQERAFGLSSSDSRSFLQDSLELEEIKLSALFRKIDAL